MVQRPDPAHPSVAESKLGYSLEEEPPFDFIKCLFKVQKKQDEVLLTFLRPTKSFLGHENVVKNASPLHKAGLIGSNDVG